MPLPWKPEFASSHWKVLRSVTMPPPSALTSLGATGSSFRYAWKPFGALRIDCRAQGIRVGAMVACTGSLHMTLESSGSAEETLRIRSRCREELRCAASCVPVLLRLFRDFPRRVTAPRADFQRSEVPWEAACARTRRRVAAPIECKLACSLSELPQRALSFHPATRSSDGDSAKLFAALGVCSCSRNGCALRQ